MDNFLRDKHEFNRSLVGDRGKSEEVKLWIVADAEAGGLSFVDLIK